MRVDTSQHLHGWFTCMSLNCMYVNVQYNMVFKAILCDKHYTDMHHKDDYMVV